MATLNINGQRVTVDDSFLQLSPEQQEQTVNEIAQQMGAGEQTATTGWLDTAGDVLASGASGFARGSADLVGLPGTIADFAQGGLQAGLGGAYRLATGEWADPQSESGVERFFAGPSQEVQDALIGGGRNPLSGQAIRGYLSGATDGATDYQPETTAGEYARTIGEFLPGGLALRGPQTVMQGAARLGLVPALASETAGQVTKDTGFEPIARVAGALLGGVVGSRMGAAQQAAQPTAREIRNSAGYGDDFTEIMRGAHLTDDAYRGVVGNLWDDVKQAGTSHEVQQNFGRTLQNELNLVRQEGASLHSLERLRRALRSAGGGTLDTPNQAIAGRLIDKLDEAVEGLSATQVAQTPGTGRPVLDALKDARQAYRTGKKAQLIEDAIGRAQTQASGVENGLRIQFRKIMNNEKLRRNFSKAEQDAISQVANGNFSTNAMRWLGSFGLPVDQGRSALGALMGGGAGAAIGSAFGGPVGAAIGGPALMAAGTASRLGADAATRNAASIAEALVKAGPQGQAALQAQQAIGRTATRESLIRALLQSQAAAGMQ